MCCLQMVQRMKRYRCRQTKDKKDRVKIIDVGEDACMATEVGMVMGMTVAMAEWLKQRVFCFYT